MRLLPAGALLITPEEARMLYQAARIAELRTRHRVGDTALYRLLTDITICALNATPGNEPRHQTASEESEQWTVDQIARATGRATRTVRNDIQQSILPAKKHGGTWVVSSTDAQTYIASKRPA